MKQRWLPVGILAGSVFVGTLLVRLAVRLFAGDDADKQGLFGWIGLGVVASTVLVAAYLWARRRPIPRVAGDLLIAAVVGSALGALVGPFVSGGRPFADGVGFVFEQFVYYLGMCAGGAIFGLLAVMIAGQDYKSQAWKRYAETVRSRPRRVVRR